MKVSSKSRYALMALVELDLRTRGGGKPVRLADLARERGIPEQYLEQLFARPAPRRPADRPPRRGRRVHLRASPRPAERARRRGALDGAPDVERLRREESDVEERATTGAVWRAAGDAYQDVLAHTTVSDLAERERQLGAGGPMYEI